MVTNLVTMVTNLVTMVTNLETMVTYFVTMVTNLVTEVTNLSTMISYLVTTFSDPTFPQILNVVDPPVRQAGEKVPDVSTLMEKLKEKGHL